MAEDNFAGIISPYERSEIMLVVLSSATGAERLKKQLARDKIHSEIIQTPKALSDGGCSYSLRFNDHHTKEVKKYIAILRLSHKGFYPEK